MSEILEIDGSILEGGGQILRISVSLSALLRIPVRVTNIRANRSKPGLAAQHTKGIQLVAEMCQAKLRGTSIGSTEIEFIPGTLKGGQYFADPKTAGSISLLLQVALPCALMADSPVTLQLKGGTNADMAPQLDYMNEVFRYTLQKFGADFGLTIHTRGYYPKGGGHVTVEIDPVKKLKAVSLTDPGVVKTVYGWSFVAGTLPIKLAYQMADGAKQALASEQSKFNMSCYKEDIDVARDNCSGIVISCETSTGCVIGGDELGRRGTDALELGRRAGGSVKTALDARACLDQYGQDQIIIYMALAEGKSSVQVGELTLHTKTAIHVAETIAKVKFNIIPYGDRNIIECTGLGYINKNIL